MKINSGTKVLYLSIEHDDELELSVSEKVKINSIDADLADHIVEFGKPPKKIKYNGTKYHLDEEAPGYFRDMEDEDIDDNWTEFISWDYYDKSEKLMLCIERWEERRFDASAGKVIGEFEITNILPVSN